MNVSISTNALNLLDSKKNNSGCSVKSFISYQRLVDEYLHKETNSKIIGLEITQHGLELIHDNY